MNRVRMFFCLAPRSGTSEMEIVCQKYAGDVGAYSGLIAVGMKMSRQISERGTLDVDDDVGRSEGNSEQADQQDKRQSSDCES